jgi:tetratricopeptide (TPR) repeat protein
MQNNVGIALLKQGKFRAAEEYLRLVLDGRRSCFSPDDEHLIHSLLNLGECLHVERKYDECIEAYQEAQQELLDRFGREDPGTQRFFQFPTGLNSVCMGSLREMHGKTIRNPARTL